MYEVFVIRGFYFVSVSMIFALKFWNRSNRVAFLFHFVIIGLNEILIIVLIFVKYFFKRKQSYLITVNTTDSFRP